MTETTQTTPLRLPLRASRSRRLQVLPIIEITVLVIGALLPLVLKDYLTVYATRVLILCLFALSFDLVWGYAGIMSFGQAVFFGTAGYSSSSPSIPGSTWEPHRFPGRRCADFHDEK